MFNVVLLGLTSFFTDVASEMVYPLVPLFLTTTLGAGPATLGLIEGIAEAVASLLKVFSGYLSDRIGRRKALTVAGYGSSVLGKAMLFWATAWGWVLVGRFVDRFGKGIRTAPRDALIAESAGRGSHGKAFGLHRGMDTAGAVVGVAFAILILEGGTTDYTRVFLWSLLPAALGVLTLLWVRDTARARDNQRAIPVLRWSMLPGELRGFLLIALVFALGNSSNTFLLLRSATHGTGPQALLLAYLIYNISYALWSYPAGRLSDRLGRRALLALGYAVYALVYLGFALYDGGLTRWPGWVLFAIYGLYSGLTDGVEKALIADLAPEGQRASALGMHATMVGIGLLPASLFAGLLWEYVSPAAPFALGSILGAVAAAGIALVVRK